MLDFRFMTMVWGNIPQPFKVGGPACGGEEEMVLCKEQVTDACMASFASGAASNGPHCLC